MTQSRIVSVMHALRVHQWPKNLLLFVPIMAGHQLTNPAQFSSCMVAFACFCLCASGLYVVNDLRDRESDRAHETKKFRPIASGEISIKFGIIIAMVCVALSFTCARALPDRFRQYLLLYAVSSLLYSMLLKQLLIIDIIALAMFYALRILAGGAATQTFVSQWLISFSLFLFTSLACLKRFSELRRLSGGESQPVMGRGYMANDIQVISVLGASAGYIAVLVIVLYVSSREVTTLYSNPQYLWLMTPIALYWVSRMWILAFRGVVDDDPVLFALRDRVNYLVGIAAAAILYLAL